MSGNSRRPLQTMFCIDVADMTAVGVEKYARYLNGGERGTESAFGALSLSLAGAAALARALKKCSAQRRYGIDCWAAAKRTAAISSGSSSICSWPHAVT
jgi:hypothetical protein